MVQLTSINPMWVGLIKILSPILIIGALLMDGQIIHQLLQGQDISKQLITLGAVGSVALVAHAIEGIVAGIMASKKGLKPIQYGIYTFFVGTVAFIDLLGNEQT